jgi:hypothetical protein
MSLTSPQWDFVKRAALDIEKGRAIYLEMTGEKVHIHLERTSSNSFAITITEVGAPKEGFTPLVDIKGIVQTTLTPPQAVQSEDNPISTEDLCGSNTHG